MNTHKLVLPASGSTTVKVSFLVADLFYDLDKLLERSMSVTTGLKESWIGQRVVP